MPEEKIAYSATPDEDGQEIIPDPLLIPKIALAYVTSATAAIRGLSSQAYLATIQRWDAHLVCFDIPYSLVHCAIIVVVCCARFCGHKFPNQSRRIRHPVRNSIPIAFAISRAIFLESSNVSTKLVMSNFHSPSSSECPWISYS